MAHTALVADADRTRRDHIVGLLAGAGYVVSPAATFPSARRLLASVRPDVLVTAVRLDGVSGMRLVAAGCAAQRDLITVVTHGGADRALQADAAARNALYLPSPIDPQLLLTLIAQSLQTRGRRTATRPLRRWPRKQTSAFVDAAIGKRRAVVVDVSYGGARLQLTRPADEPAEAAYVARFGGADVELRARPVWTRRGGAHGPWWYGVELDAPSAEAARGWQAFVDGIV